MKAQEKAKLVRLGLVDDDTVKNKRGSRVPKRPSVPKRVLPREQSTTSTISVISNDGAQPKGRDNKGVRSSAKSVGSNNSNNSKDNKSTDSSTDTENYAYLLEIDKRDVIKAQAKETIRHAQDKIERGLSEAKKQMRIVGQEAVNAYEKRNLLNRHLSAKKRQGMVLSYMRKYKQSEAQYAHIQKILKNLGHLGICIMIDDIEPEGYSNMVKNILEEKPVTEKEATDDDLLEELRSGEVKRSIS